MPARVKPSRLLRRLEAEIAAARSPLEADCKRAERAAYLARVGSDQAAQDDISQLSRRYENSPNARISAWVHLVTGLISYFQDMDAAAHDKVLRAHALSRAGRDLPLQALSAAWLAHMAYVQSDMKAAAACAAEALRHAGKADAGTRSRAGLTVAQSYHAAGRLDLAQPWYVFVHDCATADGDDATISALMHNRAALCARDLRVTEWLKNEKVTDEQHALLGAESNTYFDQMIGIKALKTLLPLLRAQVHTARGQYAEALALFEPELVTPAQPGMARFRAELLADQAWCRARLAPHDPTQRAAAKADADAAEACIDLAGLPEDRVLAHARLAQLFQVLNDAERVQRHQREATDAWTRYAAVRTLTLDQLGLYAETRQLPA